MSVGSSNRRLFFNYAYYSFRKLWTLFVNCKWSIEIEIRWQRVGPAVSFRLYFAQREKWMSVFGAVGRSRYLCLFSLFLQVVPNIWRKVYTFRFVNQTFAIVQISESGTIVGISKCIVVLYLNFSAQSANGLTYSLLGTGISFLMRYIHMRRLQQRGAVFVPETSKKNSFCENDWISCKKDSQIGRSSWCLRRKNVYLLCKREIHYLCSGCTRVCNPWRRKGLIMVARKETKK